MRDDHPYDDQTRYRPMTSAEGPDALALVLRGFDAFVRPDFSSHGVAAFERAARSFLLARPEGHEITVAERGGAIVGVIDVRDHCHVSLFFVDPDLLGRGIGRGLLETAVSGCRNARPDATELTVNSSPWAVPVYSRLGFAAADDELEKDGIRYTPMARPL